MSISNPTVSVIIPNYNHAQYLDQRIQSVLEQTYQDFEVIILDDKSSDNSAEVIKRYIDNPHVSHIVINSENSGSTFVQWNRGFQLSKGKYIWIAESDDFCEPGFIEACMDELNRDDNCSVAYCTSQYVDADNNRLETYNPYLKDIYRLNGLDFIKTRMAFGCAIWNASSAIFKKDLAIEIDKEYQNYKACGDKLFWIKMAENGNVVHINRKMNYFRQHQNKVSPRRFRDGTSLHEERQIYEYQCGQGYLSGIKRLYVLDLYRYKIKQGDFISSEIKKELIRLWGFNNPIKSGIVSTASKIYQYYNIFLRHRRPL